MTARQPSQLVVEDEGGAVITPPRLPRADHDDPHPEDGIWRAGRATAG